MSSNGSGRDGLAPPRVDRAWISFWYEPWIGMHPDWLPMLGDPALARRFATSTPSLRPAYRWFCERLGVRADGANGALPVERLSELPAALPLDTEGLARSALVIGRVAHVSHCLAQSRQTLAHLFSHDGDADGSAWRQALRQAKARPLHAQGLPPPADGSPDALRRWALPLMAGLIEDALPGAWQRLRLRCDPALVQELRPSLPTPCSDSQKRHAWRLWRAGAITSSSP